jgi:hypothetical protein
MREKEFKRRDTMPRLHSVVGRSSLEIHSRIARRVEKWAHED